MQFCEYRVIQLTGIQAISMAGFYCLVWVGVFGFVCLCLVFSFCFFVNLYYQSKDLKCS